jgi:hypothetical protein
LTALFTNHFESEKSPTVSSFCYVMKAVDGFEPTIKLLQSRALPLGYTAITDNILP